VKTLGALKGSGRRTTVETEPNITGSAALAVVKPGDVIKATMVTDDAYWLEDIHVTGKR